MNIIYKNYRLEPEGSRFNLYKTVKGTNPKTKEPCENEKTIGYSMRLETIVDEIIHDKLADKQGNTSLQEWIRQYKEAAKDIKTILK